MGKINEEAESTGQVRIVSWMGGEHWYIGDLQFLRLEEAIAYCDRVNLRYEIVRDPRHYQKYEGG